MWKLAAVILLSLGIAGVFAQVPMEEAKKANQLFNEGKRLEALPLYEDLAKLEPDEMLYQERLADCLAAKAAQLNDPGEVKATLTRERDAAKRAVELGDTAAFVILMSKIDPDVPLYSSISGPGKALLTEAEKAFSAGDLKSAMEKYTAAADVDPKLYEAPLYAGDTAYAQHDLATAAKWFARAIQVDPNRETAYRYWGDAILRYGNDTDAAKEKYIDAVVAEPYNRLAWQGITQWAQGFRAVILPPKIDRPAGPTVDPKNPKNININIDSGALDEKKNPGSSAWMMYPICRATYRGDKFKKEFPTENEYRHSLNEESECLSLVVTVLREKKIKPGKLDESLRNLMELGDAGMIDCYVLINAADEGISKDYDKYRDSHRKLLHDYIARFVVHGGLSPTP
jgi:tetratricopeptide (TPR) repeat protein